MNNTSSSYNIDIKYKYNKLKLAQDLPKTVLNTIGIQLTKLNKETGLFDEPTNEQVCAYLNKLAERKEIPHYTIYSGSCIYFLCRDNKVVYVGQTLNVYSRVFTHKQENRKLFDTVYYIRVPHKQLDKTEKAIIHYLNPEYNIQKYRIAGLKESDIIEKIYKT